MIYNINNIKVSKDSLNEYLDSLINKLFAILGIYEDCEKINDFSNYDIYVDRILTEITGCYYSIGFKNFLSISNILIGMKHTENINHKKVKSLVFHCISIINKIKKFR